MDVCGGRKSEAALAMRRLERKATRTLSEVAPEQHEVLVRERSTAAQGPALNKYQYARLRFARGGPPLRMRDGHGTPRLARRRCRSMLAGCFARPDDVLHPHHPPNATLR